MKNKIYNRKSNKLAKKKKNCINKNNNNNNIFYIYFKFVSLVYCIIQNNLQFQKV